MINFEDFKKIEIKIGTIKKAENIEGSNKLLKLLVDIGENENRQIIAGIGNYYNPKEIEEKQIAIVSNLEPKEIFGLKSEGMILAAGDSRPFLLQPDGQVYPGSQVK